MSRRRAVLAIAIAAVAAGGGGSAAARPAHWAIHDLFIETNATAGDAGLQLSADAENWKHFKLKAPDGSVLVDLKAKGRLHKPFGLSELFFEASEPDFSDVPFSRFEQRFPEGRYRFRGRKLGGRRIVAHARLSHVIPGAPNVTFPTEGAHVSPDGFRVTWEPVTTPAGVQIVTYQVVIEQGGRELSMYLPATETSATIPGEFVEPGEKIVGEVLARA